MDIQLKGKVLRLLFFVIGRSLESLSQWDEQVKSEVDSWEEPFRVKLTVLPQGPELIFEKVGGKLHFLKNSKEESLGSSNELIVYFKNLTVAWQVFTAQISFAEGVAQHRISSKGEVAKAMSVTRTFARVQFLLLPGFMAKKSLKRLPSMSGKDFLRKVHLYTLGIPFGR